MTRFEKLAARAKNELGMELFKDKVRLNQGIFIWHLRTKNSLSALHFKNLDEVQDYLDVKDN